MPGPPTINWYRADLRSPLPGGLSWPADHLYQSLLFFFPSPLSILLSTKCKLRSIGRRAEWTLSIQLYWCYRDTFSKYTQGHERLSHEYVCYTFAGECSSSSSAFLCRLFLTSSPFRSRSPSSLPFALLVALLSNISRSLCLYYLLFWMKRGFLCSGLLLIWPIWT